jgi:hypothetical protein
MLRAMPEIITTWVIRHRRVLEPGEDPLSPANLDPEHVLWALDEGECTTTVTLVE